MDHHRHTAVSVQVGVEALNCGVGFDVLQHQRWAFGQQTAREPHLDPMAGSQTTMQMLVAMVNHHVAAASDGPGPKGSISDARRCRALS